MNSPQQVNISELKANLSAYLRRVRSGETVIVSDRDRPVARLVPWSGSHDEEDDLVIEPPRRPIHSSQLPPPAGLPWEVIERALDPERTSWR